MVEREIEDVLIKTEKGMKLSRKALKELRVNVLSQGFKNPQEEIHFFKKIKPRVCGKVIYYAKLFTIESKRPRGSNKSQIKYLNNHIRRLEDFFHDHLEFYHYYRKNATYLDDQYFLRGKIDIRLRLDVHFCLADEQFSTSYDSTIATIIAFDMLIIYLKQEIEKLENNTNNTTFDIPPTKLFWTANKTDLVELIYALHSSKALNSGEADIKQMATICERILNVDLGDYYHTFLEIRARKINSTKFLDSLKDSLLQKMKDLDA